MATELDRAIAQEVARTFGGDAHVNRYYDDAGDRSIAILGSEGQPHPELSSYSTIGMHGHPNLVGNDLIPVEIAGVSTRGTSGFPNLIASLAFVAMKEHRPCAPGETFEGIVDGYGLSASLPHVILAPPFPWPELGSVGLGTSKVHWLLAVPISELERRFALEAGFDRLEDLFEKREVPYFDLDRDSVV